MKVLASISLLFIFKVCIAQAPLAMDERGKFIYYEVIEKDGLTKDSLINRARLFFKNIDKKDAQIKPSSSDSVLNATGKFIITKTSAMLSHPSGEVNYSFVAEIKNGKYRYWLTDFKFTPYQRDRYGVFVPVLGVATPLEKSPGKLNAGVWKDYIKDASEQATAFGKKFKQQMETPLKTKPVEQKTTPVSTDKW